MEHGLTGRQLFVKQLIPDVKAELTRAEFEAEAMPYMNDLFRTATRILGDAARAEDVVQELYLQAWKSYHRFERGTNCRAWLFKILFHCIQHHRRKWFRSPVLRESEEFLEANLVAPAPVFDELKDADILGALDRIPDDFRAVILLVDVEEFAYKEAAAILSLPLGTVMSRISRGRKLLRAQLQTVAESYGIGRKPAKEQGL
ncbi:sigma-70 family RNA polymerase sigma factor [Paludibaculum fermentans]|uniref:sigma-70 family RNA polymerase sigma factor n=1 Tax=Paludibaculum fermentans TaxID=1473598 RepID=UPI003EBEFDCF